MSQDKTPAKERLPQSQVCPACGSENKAKIRTCRRCSYDLTSPPLWIPTWKWHLKVLGIIYAVLVVLYFIIDALLSQLPPPLNIRDLPAETTPWLKK
ncbi:MAG: hypothetical protein HY747_10725 [Elusimicrobia bacterium]|nr:hypothetical protein [Elusimicrobiota bacterium]